MKLCALHDVQSDMFNIVNIAAVNLAMTCLRTEAETATLPASGQHLCCACVPTKHTC